MTDASNVVAAGDVDDDNDELEDDGEEDVAVRDALADSGSNEDKAVEEAVTDAFMAAAAGTGADAAALATLPAVSRYACSTHCEAHEGINVKMPGKLTKNQQTGKTDVRYSAPSWPTADGRRRRTIGSIYTTAVASFDVESRRNQWDPKKKLTAHPGQLGDLDS